MTGWQWHQLNHMQIICTSIQTYNHASISSLSFLQARCSFWCPTNSDKALKAITDFCAVSVSNKYGYGPVAPSLVRDNWVPHHAAARRRLRCTMFALSSLLSATRSSQTDEVHCPALDALTPPWNCHTQSHAPMLVLIILAILILITSGQRILTKGRMQKSGEVLRYKAECDFGNFATSKKLQKCIVPSSHCAKIHYIFHKYSIMYVVSGCFSGLRYIVLYLSYKASKCWSWWKNHPKISRFLPLKM